MTQIRGTPGLGLLAATFGFFVGFAAVALFGPTAHHLEEVLRLSPLLVSLLVAIPALSGSLLRIPFAAGVDVTGGRKPFLILLLLSIAGMSGVLVLVRLCEAEHIRPGLYPLLLLFGALSGCGIATFSVGISQVSYWFPQRQQGRALAVFGGVGNLAPGIFSFLLPLALAYLGLTSAYLIWLAFLLGGTVVYTLLGRNAPYFQFLSSGCTAVQARERGAAVGQELFPRGGLGDSLRASARVWRTWALVWIYFTTFGGFIALTAWLPTYWHSFFGVSLVKAGMLTALYSILTSLVRVAGGLLCDALREGGENTAILGLFITLVAGVLMTTSQQFELSLPAIILLSLGMGITNAAVFKLVPQQVPQAVGGAAGWVGGLGALGGFVIPPAMGFAVSDLGPRGYAIGFVVFIFLSVFALSMAWILKYARDIPSATRSRVEAGAGPAAEASSAPARLSVAAQVDRP